MLLPRSTPLDKHDSWLVDLGSAVACSVTPLCLTLCDPWTVAHQAPLSMEFPRQEYWSGLPSPSPWDLPDPGIERTSPASPASAGRFFTTVRPRKPSFWERRIWEVDSYWESVPSVPGPELTGGQGARFVPRWVLTWPLGSQPLLLVSGWPWRKMPKPLSVSRFYIYRVNWFFALLIFLCLWAGLWLGSWGSRAHQLQQLRLPGSSAQAQ